VGRYPVTLRWHPFQLRPDTPYEGVPLSRILPPAYLAQARARLEEATTSLGMPYAPPDHVPNTHIAHEAAAHAEAHGRGDAFHRALLTAYFGHGRAIGDRKVLLDVAEQVGLDPEVLARDLDSGARSEEVEAGLALAQELGITAVPTFVFPDRRALSGAQPWAVFTKAMELQGVAPRT